ncbi:VTT domain-containing protein [Rahnella sp. SL6]|uniref:DedA family protein n=1 Tax=Rahnella perminowiae TaxID=2816244 RepID=UPI001C270502|nr:VTT domain-containing protein [Rahnella perminowiae]MBU9808573.1 VTT domain-containing protein [Rahnella perminowiae]
MFSLETLETLIRTHGLLIMTPLAILEGPVVTVIAGYFARLGYFSVSAMFSVVMVGEVLGDIIFYSLGRWVIKADGQPPGWLARLGLTQPRLEKMVKSFDRKGGRLLVLAKLTHSAGALVLTGAGIARMPLVPFLFYNIIAAIPKSLFLLGLGWMFGDIIAEVNNWIAWVSLGLFILLAVTGVLWVRSKQ